MLGKLNTFSSKGQLFLSSQISPNRDPSAFELFVCVQSWLGTAEATNKRTNPSTSLTKFMINQLQGDEANIHVTTEKQFETLYN